MKITDIVHQIELPDCESFEFIHISDLHFGRDTEKWCDRYDPDRIKNKYPHEKMDLHLDLTKSLRSDTSVHSLSACVISGDLVDAGENKEVYKDVFENLTAFSKEWFGDATDRFVIIPGNHDVQWSVRSRSDKRSADGYKMALASFYDKYDFLFKMYEEFGDFLWDIKLFICKNFKVLICGIDSTLVETSATRGIGYISNSQREKIESAIADLKLIDDSECIKIAVIHHHVVPILKDITMEGEHKDRPSLTYDSRDFMRWLTKNNFSLVLHGHQHKPFIATEHERDGNRKELIIAGAGTISKILNDDEDQVSTNPNNYFNHIAISPENGIKISEYQANQIPMWGFNRTESFTFPIYHSGISVSYNLAMVLDKIYSKYRNNEYQSPGTNLLSIDLTDDLGKTSLSIALREILIAFGVLEDTDGRYILKYHHKDELTISFLNILSRQLKARGADKPKLFNDWTNYPSIKHRDLFSPLIYLANLERKWQESIGFKDEEIRRGEYILYPIFCKQNGELNILLHLHEGWSVYLIPTRTIGVHNKELWAFKNLPLKNRFEKNAHIKPLQEKCRVKNISARTTPKPSPTRGLMTLHNYDAHFYTFTLNGLQNIEIRDRSWKWFSYNECNDLDHVDLSEPEKTYQYGKDVGIFPNNLEIIQYVFDNAEKLLEEKLIEVFELPVD